MSKTDTTTWTCDGCGVTGETKPGSQPSYWIGLELFGAPLAGPDGAGWSGRKHYCLSCRDWIRQGPPQASVSDDA